MPARRCSASSALRWSCFWLFQAIYTVQPDERAVELRFGKPKEETSEPGLHFHWWPIETVEYANTAEKLIQVGELRGNTSSGLMLSGDQNIVDVKFSVAYQVSNPEAYLFNVADPDEMVRQIGESAMREAVGRRPAQDIFRDDRQGIADAVRGIIQTTLDDYGAGIAINAISIEDAAPPREVADAFDEVQRAEQDEDRFVEESNQYSNQKLGQARGEAAQVREEAAAYKNRVVQEAEGEAQRFISVYDEYAKAPEITRERLFIETMEKVLKDSNKVIIGQEGQGVVPYLPLPELQKRAPAESQVAGGKLMANRLPFIAVIAAVILFLIYSSVFVVNERQQAIVLRFGEIVDVEDRARHLFQGAVRLLRGGQRPDHRRPHPALRPRRHPRPGFGRQVLRGRRFRRLPHLRCADVPPGGVGQRLARRKRGCAPASTPHCAVSTACVASNPRSPRSARR